MSVRPGIDVESVRQEQFPITREWAWFNTASYGPVPVCNFEAQTAFLRGMMMGSPAKGIGHWWEGAAELRRLVGGLINCDPEDVAILKSTGEGLSLVALGLDWSPGDEVITYDQEFPSAVYPWLALERKGVKVRFVHDQGRFRFDPEDVEALIGPRTRVVSLSLVSFNHGFRAPIEAISRICRTRGVWLVVDAVQAAGALKVDSRELGADLISAHGYKSLCSGFGISFCYVSPSLRDSIAVPEPGWKSIENVIDVTNQLNYMLEYAKGARRYESGALNYSGMYGMSASIGLFMSLGVDAIYDRVLRLSDRVASRLDERGYRVVSSRRPGEVSGIISVEKPGTDVATVTKALADAKVACAVREGRVRISSHFFNSDDDIERLIAALP